MSEIKRCDKCSKEQNIRSYTPENERMWRVKSTRIKGTGSVQIISWDVCPECMSKLICFIVENE